MAKLDDQLKAAIAAMTPLEKDKLLFRLIPKDKKLVRQLTFGLLEGGSDDARDQRAADLRDDILKGLTKKGEHGYTPGYMLLDLRYYNARITEHVAATKDKLGEVALPVFLIKTAFDRHYEMLLSFKPARHSTLAPYLVKRLEQIMTKADKLHEDYHVEFRSDLNAILGIIWSMSTTEPLAQKAKLRRKWG